jgi:hypothetical protein
LPNTKRGSASICNHTRWYYRTEGSLEVKLLTVWTDGKERWEESEKRQEEEKIREEKESEERR